MPWWSVGKTVLAAAALVLVRDGRLFLDEPLPAQGFTLRQLLQHRSGLPDYGGLAAYREAVARGHRAWPSAELLARVGPPLFAPGQGWAYSNVGYLLVRQAIEAAAGTCVNDALRGLVLNPLGIVDVRIAAAPADLRDVAMGTLTGYDPGWVYHGLLVGPVGAAELLLDRLLTGDLLPPGLLGQMIRAHPLGGPVPGRPWATHGYGLGLMAGTTPAGTPVLGHTGSGPGSVIAVYGSPATGRTVAAFAPGDDQGAAERAAFAAIGA